MRRNTSWKISGLLLVLLGITSLCHGQNIWSEVTLKRTNVYVGQPVEVSIKVYTSTWFTSGIDPGNIQVNGAYTIYFRPVSRSFQRDGKNYAGVELIYHVFPHVQHDIEFPALEIQAESPPEGDYKGVKHTLTTKPQTIKVKPIPPGMSASGWLVTNSMQVNDRWSGSARQVKVGDVLSRTIARTANNTVSQLIPPIVWDSLPGVSMYPSRGTANNDQSKTSISASRTEIMRYLFEREGEVTIPEMVFTWYNPFQEKLFKRTLPALTIDVQPNPDLGVLATIRDSLQTESVQIVEDEEESKEGILGMSWKTFLLVLIGAGIILYVLSLIIRRLTSRLKARKEAYRHSEAYYFDHFKKEVRNGSSRTILNALYRWLDELHLPEPSIHYFARSFGEPALIKSVEHWESDWKNQQKPPADIHAWEAARKKYLHGQTPGIDENQDWINPRVV